MADILLMNPIIAAISSVRRGVPLKRRGGVGGGEGEQSISLCRSFGDVSASLGAVCLQADLTCCPPVSIVMVWTHTRF